MFKNSGRRKKVDRVDLVETFKERIWSSKSAAIQTRAGAEVRDRKVGVQATNNELVAT